jgi:hypothetical protein
MSAESYPEMPEIDNPIEAEDAAQFARPLTKEEIDTRDPFSDLNRARTLRSLPAFKDWPGSAFMSN